MSHLFRSAISASLLPMMMTHAAAEEAVPSFTLMSYNVWKGWSQVDDGFSKGIASIRESKADVVGLQEASPELALRIAKELGWHCTEKADGSAQLVSRFPIVESYGMERLTGAKIRISEQPERDIVVFNCHLDYLCYGPYAATKTGATAATVLEEERKSAREPQMRAMLEKMHLFFATSGEVPVFLTGDFNGPSSLDWTDACAPAHGNVGNVAWPASSLVIGAGFADSFRTAHPDPLTDPGNTWSAIHKQTEPQDRIDFTYHMGGGVRVAKSATFTTTVEATEGPWPPAGETGATKKNTWPSDHLAVVTVYELPAGK